MKRSDDSGGSSSTPPPEEMTDTENPSTDDAGAVGMIPIRKKSPPARVFAFFSSYGLATVTLALLGLLTWIGTLEQVDHGLYEVQRKYFEQAFLIHTIDIPNPFGKIEGATIPFKIPLPGVYLLLAILFVNMVCGAIIRARKGWRHLGILIAHSSMLLLILAGWVSFHFKTEGNMQLYEGDSSNVYRSYTEWAVEVVEVGDGAESDVLVIPEEEFADLRDDRSRTFSSDSLPFDLTLSGYSRNAMVGTAEQVPGARAVDGFALRPVKKDSQAEANVAAAYVVAGDTEGILWGLARHPLTVEAEGKTFLLKMTRRSWVVPFTVVLDKFTRALHPGTGIAREYSSDITKVGAEGREEKIKIAMNEPLRDRGYTFFQASWGPEDARPGEPLYSVFAVVKNPSDYWPLYACIMVGVGLLVHFLGKLLAFIQRSNRRRPPAAA
ncbi:hypothetical protein BH23VER1_BH23VER1_10250 [soil metagenome]